MKEVTFEDFQKLVHSLWPRKILTAAVELEIFTKIQKRIDTAVKIADSLNTKTKGIERLLNAQLNLRMI